MEFKHADRSDNIQMNLQNEMLLLEWISSNTLITPDRGTVYMCVDVYDDKLHSEDSEVYISDCSYSENVVRDPEV